MSQSTVHHFIIIIHELNTGLFNQLFHPFKFILCIIILGSKPDKFATDHKLALGKLVLFYFLNCGVADVPSLRSWDYGTILAIQNVVEVRGRRAWESGESRERFVGLDCEVMRYREIFLCEAVLPNDRVLFIDGADPTEDEAVIELGESLVVLGIGPNAGDLIASKMRMFIGEVHQKSVQKLTQHFISLCAFQIKLAYGFSSIKFPTNNPLPCLTFIKLPQNIAVAGHLKLWHYINTPLMSVLYNVLYFIFRVELFALYCGTVRLWLKLKLKGEVLRVVKMPMKFVEVVRVEDVKKGKDG